MSRRLQLIWLLLLTVLVYQSVRTHPFLYEDAGAIYQNPVVRGDEPVNYTRTRWLTSWTYRLTFKAVGDKPAAYHLTSLGLHLVNGGLVYEVGTLVVAPEAALVGAGLFLLHPLNGEAVNYAASRTDLLSTLFVLMAVWLAWGARYRTCYTFWRGVGIFVCAAAAMCAKESAVVVVPLLLLDPHESSWRALRRWWMPIAALSVVVGLAALTVLHYEYRAAADHSVVRYAAIQSAAVWRYLEMIIEMRGFTVDHDFEVIPQWVAWLAVAASVATVVWGIVLRRSIWGLDILWAAVALFPRFVLPVTEFLTEHQVYLALVPVWLALGAAFVAAVEWARRRMDTGVVVGALATLMVFATVGGVERWSTPSELWRTAVEATPENARALLNYATTLDGDGLVKDAAPIYQRVIASVPNVPSASKRNREAWSAAAANLGRLNALAGQSDTALQWLTVALRADGRNAGALYNRALVLADRPGGCQAAQRDYLDALRLAPQMRGVWGLRCVSAL